MKKYYKELEVLYRVRSIKKSREYDKGSEVLQTVKKERNIPHIIKWKQANWIGPILCIGFFLKHVTEGRQKGEENNEEDTRRLDELRETRKS